MIYVRFFSSSNNVSLPSESQRLTFDLALHVGYPINRFFKEIGNFKTV